MAYTFFTPEMSMTSCVLLIVSSLETARATCSAALWLERIAALRAGGRRRCRGLTRCRDTDDHLRAFRQRAVSSRDRRPLAVGQSGPRADGFHRLAVGAKRPQRRETTRSL